jgi:hypothetical protein
MVHLQIDDRATEDETGDNEGWEKARARDEADGCAAGLTHDRPGAVCPRGSRCHCGRPIGHPVPVVVPHERDTER